MKQQPLNLVPPIPRQRAPYHTVRVVHNGATVAEFTSPALARHYIKTHALKGRLYSICKII